MDRKLRDNAALILQTKNLTCAGYEAAADSAALWAARLGGGYGGAAAIAASIALNNQARTCREVNSANNALNLNAIGAATVEWDATVCDTLKD